MSVYVRKNQKNLTIAEQQAYIDGITKLINNYTYGELVSIHADMSHNMHAGMDGPNSALGVSQQRFLPWHRAYLLTLEHIVQKYQPDFSIPYWDWAVDQDIPQWIQGFMLAVPLPIEMGSNQSIPVTRSPQGRSLPSPRQIQDILSIQDYTNFATRLEILHDTVHTWFGDTSTMADIMSAPADPIFFMHHANVDRIWSLWQQNFPGQNPILADDDLIMDPFPYTESETRKIEKLGYAYQT